MPETDRLIDAGLAELMANEPAMTDEAFDRGQDRLLAAMGAGDVSTSAPRKRGRWLVAAAAAVVLTAGMLVAQTLVFDDGAPQASAADVLNKAARLAATSTDQPVGWVERRGVFGKQSWVPGHEGNDAELDSPALIGEWTAPCGAFDYYADDSKPSCDKGGWDNPSPEFLAGLPTDPRQLYKRLLADSGNETDAVIDVGHALGNGRIPAEYRALLYRALAHAPNLRVTEQVATLDGRTGTALGIDDSYGEFTDFIIDPDNGQFIGYRSVLSAEEHGLAAGTVREWSSTTTAVVDTVAR